MSDNTSSGNNPVHWQTRLFSKLMNRSKDVLWTNPLAPVLLCDLGGKGADAVTGVGQSARYNCRGLCGDSLGAVVFL